VGRKAFQALHPQYAQGDYFRTTIGQLVSYLSQFRKTMEWDQALDELEGTNAVPIMTIHKSKGLEYHTVVFVGFEDSAFWNYHKSQPKKPVLSLSRSHARKIALSLHSASTEPNRQMHRSKLNNALG
jgi:ATP-dependent exoDNAse (exonuclease V) beta subunit